MDLEFIDEADRSATINEKDLAFILMRSASGNIPEWLNSYFDVSVRSNKTQGTVLSAILR